MNKKVLSAILFSALFAGTGTFTSCIDTDEPAGIENLRGAKAELIRAKVEVEKANAAVQNAEAERLKAVAAVEQANAEYRLAETKWMEAKAEYEQAVADEKKAWAEKQMADYQNQMQLAAETLKSQIAQAKQWAAEAEFAYSTALKQIAIAEALGNNTQTSLSYLKGEIENCYEAIYVDEYENGKTLVEVIRDAEEDLYDAMLAKSAGYDNGNMNGDPTIWIPSLEAAVAGAEANVEAQNEKIAKIESFLEKDVETTDWRAEIEELNDSAEALKLAISVKEIEIEKQLNGEEYLAAKQKVDGVNAGGGAVEKGTVQLLQDAKDNYNLYAVGGTKAKKLYLTPIAVPVSSVLTDEIDDAITALQSTRTLSTDAKGNKYISILASNDANTGNYLYNQPVYGTTLDANNYYAPAVATANIDAWTKILAKTEVSAQDVEQYKRDLKDAQDEEAKMDSLYNEVALPLWKSALAVMDGGAATATIPAAETKKATDAIAAYNTKVAALSAAVDAYNAAYEAAFKAEYDKFYNEAYYNKFYTQVLTDMGKTELWGANASLKVTAALAGITETSAKIAALEAMYVTTVKDDATTTDKNEATLAQGKVDGYLATSKTAASLEAQGKELEQKTTWEASAKANMKTDWKTAKLKGITDADAAVGTAYTTMGNAVADYLARAEMYYALVPGEGAKAVPSTAATYEFKSETGLYAMKGAAISADDSAKMVLLALSEDENVIKAAWNETSKLAFGVTGRYVEVAEKDAVAGSALANWADAKKDLADCEAEIAAADKLAEVKTALAAAKTALAAEAAANEALFADLKAAVVAADKANEDAKAELKVIEDELIGDLRIEQAKLKAKYNAVNTLAGEIAREVANHLHLDGVTSYTDAAAFEKALENNLKVAKETLIGLEQAVAKAEAALQKAKDGKYDAVADAQYKLDQLNAELARRQDKYEQALADLETALAAIAE